MRNQKELVMYMHAGSGNHGCEAIVNSLCHMIEEDVMLISYAGEEDQKYSLKELCHIIQERRFEDHRIMHVLFYLYRRLTGDKESFIRYRYGQVFRKKAIPLAVSIGGDNYCYDSMLNDLRLANRAFNKAGSRTVLLGCSIEPELLKREDILADLAEYHTIIARESITYKALQAAFEGREAKPVIRNCPDPAFTLKKEELPLPEGFVKGNTVGINISPMIQENESQTGITLENYRALIRYIIEKTDMQIALIPHVIWQKNDDRKPIHSLYEEFKDSKRVIEIPDCSCTELKGFISRCRFFVGARTHATIAAYSSGIPTLVVGYSVKARGIARDLFGSEENYVLPVQNLKEKDDLTKGFEWIMQKEEEIKTHLKSIMPDYQKEACKAGREIDRLWEEFSRQLKI